MRMTPVDSRGPEAGFTMIATLIGITVMMALALVTVTAVQGDISLTSRDETNKQAYEAAKAGIENYAFHLYSDPLYWSKCTNVPEPNAVNQIGSTTKRLSVPGEAEATYAIELLPATGQSSCKTTAPTESMIEQSGELTGSFRIRATGYFGSSTARIVATFKRPSFLDYVYFTQLETSDPVTYGYPNPSPELTGAYSQCELTYEQGRYENPIPGTGHKNGRGQTEYEYCNKINFVTGDTINGPLHTNDAISICGNPVFGREGQADLIETGAKSPGWYSSCNGSAPKFNGTRITSAPILMPPETNSKLKTLAESGYSLKGQNHICLEGANMKVSATSATCAGATSKPIPPNGVVYDSNTSCSAVYSPFNLVYNENATAGCGNVYIHGTYTGQLTVAAENDVIIDGSLCRASCTTASGAGMLGLIANNFIRVYHPCSNGTNGTGSMTNPVIDAAVLAIKHSFIVDNYDCGAQMGTLTLEGAIGQKFRGPVGTSGGNGTGYLKNYKYDDRLRYLEPPSFIEPTGSAWIIGRETTG